MQSLFRLVFIMLLKHPIILLGNTFAIYQLFSRLCLAIYAYFTAAYAYY